jgi:hypothetical protein
VCVVVIWYLVSSAIIWSISLLSTHPVISRFYLSPGGDTTQAPNFPPPNFVLLPLGAYNLLPPQLTALGAICVVAFVLDLILYGIYKVHWRFSRLQSPYDSRKFLVLMFLLFSSVLFGAFYVEQFSTIVYPLIPEQFGGGQERLVQFAIPDSATTTLLGDLGLPKVDGAIPPIQSIAANLLLDGSSAYDLLIPVRWDVISVNKSSVQGTHVPGQLARFQVWDYAGKETGSQIPGTLTLSSTDQWRTRVSIWNGQNVPMGGIYVAMRLCKSRPQCLPTQFEITDESGAATFPPQTVSPQCLDVGTYDRIIYVGDSLLNLGNEDSDQGGPTNLPLKVIRPGDSVFEQKSSKRDPAAWHDTVTSTVRCSPQNPGG